MNSTSRTENSVKNISSGLLFQVIQMILGFISRTIFIKYLAVEYLGINSLFSNILILLSLAELGIGSALTFALYKPLAEKDEHTIGALLNFYKKTYIIIGFLVLLLGLIFIPFLDDIIPNKPLNIVEDIRIIYFIFLLNSVSTYFFAYKLALLEANQENAVISMNKSFFLVAQNLIQIAILVIFANFIAYLLVQIICNFLAMIYISKIVDKKYPFIAQNKNKLDSIIKKGIIKNTIAVFYRKIGGILIIGTDSLFINYFKGLAVLGVFSNYTMLMALISSITTIIFANIRSSIAHLVIKENKQKQNEIFNVINFANFWIYGLFSVMMIFLINDFITIWIGVSYVMTMPVVIALAINFFMVGMLDAFWMFKSVYGLFTQGKYIGLIIAFLNLLFSYILGNYYGVFGVIIATSLARLVTVFWYDPYITLKFGLEIKPVIYFFKFIKYIVTIFVSCLLIYLVFNYLDFSPILNFILKTLVAFIVPNALIIVLFKNNSEFVYLKLLVKGLMSTLLVKLKL